MRLEEGRVARGLLSLARTKRAQRGKTGVVVSLATKRKSVGRDERERREEREEEERDAREKFFLKREVFVRVSSLLFGGLFRQFELSLLIPWFVLRFAVRFKSPTSPPPPKKRRRRISSEKKRKKREGARTNALFFYILSFFLISISLHSSLSLSRRVAITLSERTNVSSSRRRRRRRRRESKTQTEKKNSLLEAALKNPN
jgi:hypothetical protein